MKLRFITLALAAIAIGAAAEETPDTLTRISNVDTLTVVRTPDGIKVRARGRADNPDFLYEYAAQYAPDTTANGGWGLTLPFLSGYSDSRQHHGRKNTAFNVDFEIYAGTSIPTGHTPVGASFEVGISRLLNAGLHLGGGFSINAGAGIGYLQYAVGDGMTFASEGRRLLLVARPEGLTGHSARLRMWRVHIPVMFTQKLSRRAYISAGTWLNFNFGARARSSQTVADQTTTHTFKELHTRTLSADLLLAAGFRGIGGVYLRYAPTGLFRSGWGPEFNSVSVGYIVNF